MLYLSDALDIDARAPVYSCAILMFWSMSDFRILMPNKLDWTGLTEMGHLVRPVGTDVGRVPNRLPMGIRMAQTCPQCGYEANERIIFAALHSQ